MADQTPKQEQWNYGLSKWITPLLLCIISFVGKEYYVSLNAKFDNIIAYMYRNDSIRMNYQYRINTIESIQQRYGIELENIKEELNQMYYLKPEEIKLKKRP